MLNSSKNADETTSAPEKNVPKLPYQLFYSNPRNNFVKLKLS